jgi:glutamate-1-semialdehyde 2,1-aminomutase
MGLGVPQQIWETTRFAPGGDREALDQVIAEVGEECAAVTLCPDMWAPDDLRSVVEACRRTGIVVVFDEVTSGIRMGRQATAGEVGVWPDLLCISKGLANGLPLAAVIGSHSLMGFATTVRFSNAHSSECLALAAAVACEGLMGTTAVWPTWRHRTIQLLDTVSAEISRLGLSDEIQVQGSHASFCLRRRNCDDFWRDDFREHLIRRLAENQVFSKGYMVFSDLHSREDITLVEHLIIDALVDWQ